MKIYVASSWRNPYYEKLVATLCAVNGGPEYTGGPSKTKYHVYDFKNPKNAFNWREALPLGTPAIDRTADVIRKETWPPDVALTAIRSKIARGGFLADFTHLKSADVCVLCLPAGNSAHLEAGYARGLGVPVFLYVDPDVETLEPELMWRMFPPAARSIPELLALIDAGHKPA